MARKANGVTVEGSDPAPDASDGKQEEKGERKKPGPKPKGERPPRPPRIYDEQAAPGVISELYDQLIAEAFPQIPEEVRRAKLTQRVASLEAYLDIRGPIFDGTVVAISLGAAAFVKLRANGGRPVPADKLAEIQMIVNKMRSEGKNDNEIAEALRKMGATVVVGSVPNPQA